MPFSKHLQVPSKDTSFLERPSLCGAKRLCIQGRYRRYKNVVFSLSFKVPNYQCAEASKTGNAFQKRVGLLIDSLYRELFTAWVTLEAE